VSGVKKKTCPPLTVELAAVDGEEAPTASNPTISAC
jgi:hypothetical protein